MHDGTCFDQNVRECRQSLFRWDARRDGVESLPAPSTTRSRPLESHPVSSRSVHATLDLRRVPLGLVSRTPMSSIPPAQRVWLVASVCAWLVGCESRSSQTTPVVVTDGRFDEWDTVPAAVIDSADAPADAAVDLGAVQVLDDPHYLYLAIDFGRMVNAQAMRGTVRVLFDADGKRRTGVVVRGLRGTDFILELSRRDDPSKGAYGAGVGVRVVNRDVLSPIRPGYIVDALIAPTHSSTRFEIRVRRGIALDGGPPLFAGSTVRMRLIFEDSEGVRDETETFAYHPRTDVEAVMTDSSMIDLGRATGAFRVVQWNVADARIFASPDPFLRILAALQPDVVLLDEVFGTVSPSELERFFESPPLGGLGEWRFIMSRTGGRQKTVVASRLPIAREERLSTVNYASGAIDRLEDSVADPRLQRLFSLERERGVPATGAWVSMTDGQIERPTLFVPLDLQSGGYDGSGEDRLRELQAATIGERIADALTRRRGVSAVVVGGDFNLVGSERPLNALRTKLANMDQAVEVAEPYRLTDRSQATWRGRPEDPFTPGRLDYVLFSSGQLEVDRAFVFDTDEIPQVLQTRLGLEATDSRQSSDHLPIVVDFRWRRE